MELPVISSGDVSQWDRAFELLLESCRMQLRFAHTDRWQLGMLEAAGMTRSQCPMVQCQYWCRRRSLLKPGRSKGLTCS